MKIVARILCCAALSSLVVGVPVHAAVTSVTSQIVAPTDPLNPAGPAAAPIILSDAGNGYSTTYTNGSLKVGSYFQSGGSNGDWQLDTTSSPRTMWIDLGDPSQVVNAQYLHTLLTTHCNTWGLTPVGLLKGVGSSTTCPTTIRINYGTDPSVHYELSFNTHNLPGTGDVKYTCLSVASDNSCVSWSGVPADNDYTVGDGRSTGRLFKVTTTKSGSETKTQLGDYNVIFQFHITKP